MCYFNGSVLPLVNKGINFDFQETRLLSAKSGAPAPFVSESRPETRRIKKEKAACKRQPFQVMQKQSA
ncbi:MAG: hypothetical protein AMK71_10080 [Nitrospira bacterium SG8_35_4]|nr:MAG: hypothetical protein AMK71_10080 [Nitrospira bacterium SG8_35_4]